MSAHLDEETLAGLALLPPDAPLRREAEEHLAACPACRAELASAEALVASLDALPAPAPPSAAVLERSRASIHALLEAEASVTSSVASIVRAPTTSRVASPVTAASSTEARRVGALAALVGVVAWGVLGVMHGVHLEGAVELARWAMAALVVGLASLLAMRVPRVDAASDVGLALAATLGLSTLVTAFDVVLPASGFGQHGGCERFELVTALVPLVIGLGHVRAARARGLDRGTAASRGALAGATGALLGQAVLLTRCSPDSLVHVVVFHELVVVAVAALGALGGALLAAPRSAR